jgi:hypothetical protein
MATNAAMGIRDTRGDGNGRLMLLFIVSFKYNDIPIEFGLQISGYFLSCKSQIRIIGLFYRFIGVRFFTYAKNMLFEPFPDEWM